LATNAKNDKKGLSATDETSTTKSGKKASERRRLKRLQMEKRLGLPKGALIKGEDRRIMEEAARRVPDGKTKDVRKREKKETKLGLPPGALRGAHTLPPGQLRKLLRGDFY